MIRVFGYPLLASVIVFSACSPDPRTTKEGLYDEELGKLQGTWRIVYRQVDGVEAPENSASFEKLTFRGNIYEFSNGFSGKITMIDPTTSPKSIEYENFGGDPKRHYSRAIYELEGDTFTDCMAFGDSPRPQAFSAKKGTKFILQMYKRINK